MRTPSTLAAVALVALSLTACSGTSTPAASVPTAAATTASPASSPTPDTGKAALEAAVRAYSNAYFAGDSATAYSLLSKRCSNSITKGAYASLLANAVKSYGKQAIKSLTVDQLSGDLARVSYTYSVPMLNQASQPWMREGGAWHYDAC